MSEQDAIPLNFGLWLKEQRNALDLRQKDLAQHIGCSTVAVAKFEAGQRRPSTQIAERLAEYFHVLMEERPAFIRFARGRPDSPDTTITPHLARAASVLRGANSGPEAMYAAQFSPRAPWRNVNSPEYLSSYPNNLPVQPTSFVGRHSQTVTACNLLMRQSAHLLTLTGPPGIGKTRLALHIATHLLDVFRDGVYFVPLSHVNTPERAMNQIAHTLGVSEETGTDLLESIKKYLRARYILLVLDNYEQLVPSAVFLLTELLRGAAGLKILLTSRARLRLYGEHELEVPALRIPDLAKPKKIDVQSAEDYEAVQLFVERAIAAKADFALSSDNVRAVMDICAHLDGLPLAIELAAAQVKTLPPQQMLQQLEGRQYLAWLSEGPHDVPIRHQTMSNAIAWSYNLLDADEQALFRTLSTFTGTLTLQAAREVAGHDKSPTNQGSNAPASVPEVSEVDLLNKMTSLVDKGLLRHEGPALSVLTGSRQEGQDTELANDEHRFSMLHVIKEYGLKELEKCGELESAQEKHARYYVQLAQRAEGELRGPRQDEWLNVIATEYENMLAALQVMEERGATEDALYLLAALGPLWLRRGHFVSEGLTHMKLVLSRSESVERERSIPGIEVTKSSDERWRRVEEVRAKVLHLAAGLAWKQAWTPDDFRTARLFNEESVAVSRKVGDKGLLARTLNLSGILALEDRDYDLARSLLEECLEIASAPDNKDKGVRLSILNNLGQIAWQQGDDSAARWLFERSVAEGIEAGDTRRMVYSQNSLGRVLVHQGDCESAHALLEKALDLSSQLDDPHGRSTSLRNLGLVALKQGDYAEAQRLFEESLIIVSELGGLYRVSWCFTGLAAVAIAKVAAGQTAGQDTHSEAIRAAQLLGAVDSIWNSYDGVISVADQQDYQELVDTSHTQLDEASWQKAWSEGQALSMQQAVNIAFRRVIHTHDVVGEPGSGRQSNKG